MSEDPDVDLYEQAVSLLRPGETELVGVVVHTDFTQAEEPAMSKRMKEVGDQIAEVLTDEETYIYSGDDDERFSPGQFHGRRLADDGFVWECQQLIRDDTFDLVFYWEAGENHDDVVAALEDIDSPVVPVTEDGFVLP